MIGYSKETTLAPAEVLARADQFFGDGGVGLVEAERDDCSARFEGGGGHVYVHVVEKNAATVVGVDSREWDYQARQFLDAV